MTKENATPWTVRAGNNPLKPYHIECDGRYILSMERKEDADKMVLAVNNFERLERENERLKEERKTFVDYMNKCEQAIANLKTDKVELVEALKEAVEEMATDSPALSSYKQSIINKTKRILSKHSPE